MFESWIWKNCVLCLGWKMALTEMTVITAVILRHFNISTTTKLDDIKINFAVVIWPNKKPNCILSERKLSEDLMQDV